MAGRHSGGAKHYRPVVSPPAAGLRPPHAGLRPHAVRDPTAAPYAGGWGAGPGPSSSSYVFTAPPNIYPNSLLNNPLAPLNPFLPLQNPNFDPRPLRPHPPPRPQQPILLPAPVRGAAPGPGRSVSSDKALLERVEAAAVKAHEAILKSGEAVTAWAVVQAVPEALKVKSWVELGVKMQDVKRIQKLFLLEGRVDALVHCFVGARMIATLYDLEVAICKNERVANFEDLSLGPLCKHPLIKQYFALSSGLTKACHISCHETVRYLSEFLIKSKKKTVVKEEFLDYVVKEKSVQNKEQLGLLIQNLGLCICFIRRSRRDELNMLSKATVRICGLPKNKIYLNSRFDVISERVKSFSSEWSDSSSKHIYFDLSDDDLDEENNRDHEKKASSQPVEGATYSKHSAGKKRKLSMKDRSKVSSGKKRKEASLDETVTVKGNVEPVLGTCSLSKSHLERFVATWKETCREYSVSQIMELMLNLYADTEENKIHLRTCYSTYPGIALLNIAVRSMAYGNLDSLYDTIQFFDRNGSCANPGSAGEVLEIELENDQNALFMSDSATKSKSITLEDIIKKVGDFFKSCTYPVECNSVVDCRPPLPLKTLHECEIWVNNLYSVENFECLGFGSFLAILVNNAKLVPPEFYTSEKPDVCELPPVAITLPPKQVKLLLYPAGVKLPDGEAMNNSIGALLQKQFPTVGFHIFENNLKSFSDIMERENVSEVSKNILFSVSLLGNGQLLSNDNDVDGTVEKKSQFNRDVTRDAMDCLLKAPMLSDLLHWSHWDAVFAPSLGPFLEWLLKAVHNEELSCIITKDGKFIKVEPLASVDQFLEACIQCSAFQVALKLLSLLRLYNGVCHAPVSLLKCYAQRGINVLIRNVSESGNGDATCNGGLAEVDSATRHVSKFILDSLSYLPSEFWSFGADILMSGVKHLCGNIYSVLLNECGDLSQRCMLHDIGFSLGITEWIEDYSKLLAVVDKKIEISTSNASDTMKQKCVVNQPYEPQCNPVDYRIGESEFPEINAEVGDGISIHTEHIPESVDAEAAVCGVAKDNIDEAAAVIESIRKEEFGLDQNISDLECHLLRKQHARLGRALQCLSQELYSQDSHLLLELVQNADDNTYPDHVEPTLAFILHDSGIVLLNNEKGFSAKNIRALCDIGNSTKKSSGAGYIGNKGIGFKSVFRITDAPEIHSNGYHIKFDITEGQIGFVLPTPVSPCDLRPFSHVVDGDNESHCFWNTCISLPFRADIKVGKNLYSIVSMFSDLHPSLLLFLHRLKCIKYKNMLNGSLLVMRKKAVGYGIVKVFYGSESANWLVVSKKIQGNVVRRDMHTTEIAMAFTLQENDEEVYEPCLKQQPVFAFLPLRNYGLKFILQGDFVLPSSREEVDRNSAWNQWLLSEFPGLFISAKQSFCALPCFAGNASKAVSAYMSFVPLIGEVHGFFSLLPNMIISNLRMTRCLICESPEIQWVYPCRALRGWDEQARLLMPDDLLLENLGLSYLSKDVIISDTLAASLGIPEYSPKILVDMMASLCQRDGALKLLGMGWLSAWLATLHELLLRQKSSVNSGIESDILGSLTTLPFVPLLDGSFSSFSDGTIWLPCDFSSRGSEIQYDVKYFPSLYAKLRTVSPLLMSTSNTMYHKDQNETNSMMEMMQKLGVRKLCAHEIIKCHILPSLSDCATSREGKSLMIEYTAFIMLHFQYPCASCSSEREIIISELGSKPILLTNRGYKCARDEPIHFCKELGNPIDIQKLFEDVKFDWIELDSAYLRYHSSSSSQLELQKWRHFFQELGVTDFVHVFGVEKHYSQSDLLLPLTSARELSCKPSIVRDWESPELVSMLSAFSVKQCRHRSIYLLEILDMLWDEFYADKVRISINSDSNTSNHYIESSFIKSLREYKWVASSMDESLHYAKDLFFRSEAVQSLLGSIAPYCVPQVCSKLLLDAIGFKTEVDLNDALAIFDSWRMLVVPFGASLEQMARLYAFIYQENNKLSVKKDVLSSSMVFVPYFGSKSGEIVRGQFLSPSDVFWHDPTGCCDIIWKLLHQNTNGVTMNMLSVLYPNLHDFFVGMCGVPYLPTSMSYADMLLHISRVTVPSQVSDSVRLIFGRWADELNFGKLKKEDISHLKDNLHELNYTILPTVADNWVSLHNSFGLVCWPDDKEMKQDFEDSDVVTIVQLAMISSEDKSFGKIGMLMKILGIPAISEVVRREPHYYGVVDSTTKAHLLDLLFPYMQRYLYKMHPDVYANVNRNVDKISELQIVVVRKLYYKYALKVKSTSTKRFECSALLQGNVLYATRDSNMHTVYLELSRLFFSGSTDLQFANFLHMITTMAQSGSNNEQLEYFIINSQMIPELPESEPFWPRSLSPEQLEDRGTLAVQLYPVHGSSSASSVGIRREQVLSASCPPSDLKIAPKFGSYCSNLKTMLTPDNGLSPVKLQPADTSAQVQNVLNPVEIDGEWIIEDGLKQHGLLVSDAVIVKDQLGTVNDGNLQFEPAEENSQLLDMSEVSCRAPDEHQIRATGRLGELVAYTYFVNKFGSAKVKWVNEETESGLPYDLVIGEDDSPEFIEVKATRSSRKGWFYITSREWQFASERGDSFSIAHVVLLCPGKASIVVLRNPHKLCQQKILRLGIMMTQLTIDSRFSSGTSTVNQQ